MLRFLLVPALALGALVAYLPLTIITAPDTLDDCEVVRGVLVSAGSPCCEDVALWLEDDRHRYHVNRGLEQGLDVAGLQGFVGQEVDLWIIPRRWSPLDPHGTMRAVAQITTPQGVYFSVVDAGDDARAGSVARADL